MEGMLQDYVKKGYLESDFKMFYLSDGEPKEYENHYHEFDKIIILLKGKVSYVVEGRAYELLPYDIVFVGHHDIHRLRVESGHIYERIIIYIAPEFLAKYQGDSYCLNNCFVIAKKEQTNVLRITNLSKSKVYHTVMDIKSNLHPANKHEKYAHDFYLQLLFLEFMVHLNRACIGEKVVYINTSVYNQKVIDILDFINANLAEEINIETLANKFYMSKYHMMRSFKEETGYTIGNYISNKRLLYAKELILSGIPITQACFACGFKEHSTFSRAFKNLFLESPRQMKKNINKN